MTATYERVTVKVGSNVLMRGDGMLDVARMSALVDRMVALRRAGIEAILISSGVMVFGRQADRRGAGDGGQRGGRGVGRDARGRLVGHYDCMYLDL